VSERAYPIRPQPEDDSRFTFGLTADVIKVLESHGYPPVKNGLDIVALQQALYRFLYVGEERP
jgi:methyl coenzyme M reductase alpha subunit